jgi:hypothetical protein
MWSVFNLDIPLAQLPSLAGDKISLYHLLLNRYQSDSDISDTKEAEMVGVS